MPERKEQAVSQPRRSSPALSPHRAFVVQFYERVEGQAESWAGQVEHISSGRATRFHSSEALWSFFTEVLVTLTEKTP
jgi:hypothetical protein